jgi:hypothetical protein
LFEAIDVAHAGRGGYRGERPAIILIQWQRVLPREQDKALGADLLVKIARQRERKL